MTLGYSWSLLFILPMILLNLIQGLSGVYISLQMNEMINVKYDRRNEADSMLSKEGPWVDFPYVGPSH